MAQVSDGAARDGDGEITHISAFKVLYLAIIIILNLFILKDRACLYGRGQREKERENPKQALQHVAQCRAPTHKPMRS